VVSSEPVVLRQHVLDSATRYVLSIVNARRAPTHTEDSARKLPLSPSLRQGAPELKIVSECRNSRGPRQACADDYEDELGISDLVNQLIRFRHFWRRCGWLLLEATVILQVQLVANIPSSMWCQQMTAKSPFSTLQLDAELRSNWQTLPVQ
jgi:hypothetical protein